MGVSVDNRTAGKHVSGGVALGYRLHLHRGDQGVETWSPDVPKSTWEDLRDIANTGTLSQLDAAGAAAWPDWWPQFVHAREGGVAAVRLTLLP